MICSSGLVGFALIGLCLPIFVIFFGSGDGVLAGVRSRKRVFASAADEPVTAAVPKRQKRREEPSLDARDVPQVTDVGLAEIAAECHALERLDINSCLLVTDKGLIAVAQGCWS